MVAEWYGVVVESDELILFRIVIVVMVGRFYDEK